MNKILADIARWLLGKIATLVVLVSILLGSLWVKNEWNSLQSRRETAEKNESMAQRLIQDLKPLEAEINQAKEQAREIGREIERELSSKADLLSKAKQAEARAEENLQDIRNQELWFYTRLINPDYYLKLEAAERLLEAAKSATTLCQTSLKTVQVKAARSNTGQNLSNLVNQLTQKRSDIRSLQSQSSKIRDEIASRPIEKLRAQTLSVLPTALIILVGVILTPILIKAFLYFCIAPLISKTKPVVVISESGGEVEVGSSSVSIPISLAPNDELIVHSDFLQAAGAGPGKRTRWLLSWRMPFTSIAAGLYMMVSVRNRNNGDSRVTVSPKDDLFDMICDVRIPAGSSVVIYPRSLVGVVLRNGVAPRITRHWHLASLHSWITFQFRYLVIHGESQILIKGCRGVRAERVETTTERMQDQGSTLGFTANLAYSGVRCETFIDYLRGRDELFNDRFSGANGFHFTEEISNPNRRKGLFGRGLEGLLDGFLKAFGI